VLERRLLLAHGAGFDEGGDLDQQRLDLNGDSSVTPLDALIAINALDRARSQADPPSQRLDVTGDGRVNADDVDAILTRLASPRPRDGRVRPEGEQVLGSERDDDLLPNAAGKLAVEESPHSSLWLAESGSVSGAESNPPAPRDHGKIHPVCFAGGSRSADGASENAEMQTGSIPNGPPVSIQQADGYVYDQGGNKTIMMMSGGSGGSNPAPFFSGGGTNYMTWEGRTLKRSFMVTHNDLASITVSNPSYGSTSVVITDDGRDSDTSDEEVTHGYVLYTPSGGKHNEGITLTATSADDATDTLNLTIQTYKIHYNIQEKRLGRTRGKIPRPYLFFGRWILTAGPSTRIRQTCCWPTPPPVQRDGITKTGTTTWGRAKTTGISRHRGLAISR